MEHTHEHHHHRITSLNKAFIIGITLNTAFVVVEFVAGFWFNSLGLLSDAGHNLSDFFSLVFPAYKPIPNTRTATKKARS